jgi:hypothetical protein
LLDPMFATGQYLKRFFVRIGKQMANTCLHDQEVPPLWLSRSSNPGVCQKSEYYFLI